MWSPARNSSARSATNSRPSCGLCEFAGIGTSAEALPRVSDRFYHLEKNGDELYGGLGIGLAITRQVIQQHHGTMSVESRLGRGSTFTISLPL